MGFDPSHAPDIVSNIAALAAEAKALGGALFTFTEGDARSANPPLFGALATGLAVFYSIGDHAEDARRAQVPGLGPEDASARVIEPRNNLGTRLVLLDDARQRGT